jgi:hypothetical protein
MRNGENIGLFFDRYDLFGSNMPSFNMEGQKKIGSSIGFLSSLLLVVITFGHAIVYGHLFLTGERAFISQISIENYSGHTREINFKQG